MMNDTLDRIKGISQKVQDGSGMPNKGTEEDISKDYEDSLETATEGGNEQSVNDLEKVIAENAEMLKENWNFRKEYLANRLKSSEIQSSIIKGLQKGESIYSLFLQAMRCISLMVDNETLFLQAEKDIMAIYGEGLSEAEPLQMCIDQVTERLTRLRSALSLCYDTDQAKRIETAIKVHENELAILKEKKTGA